MDDWDANDFPLPNWAKRRSNGTYMEIGAQLATRDGRRCGNAYIDSVETHPEIGKLAVVVTDIGTCFKMTLAELEEAFYPPAYIMRVKEARSRRRFTP